MPFVMRLVSGVQRRSGKFDAQRTDNFLNGFVTRLGTGRKRLVQTLATEAGVLRQLGHATRDHR